MDCWLTSLVSFFSGGLIVWLLDRYLEKGSLQLKAAQIKVYVLKSGTSKGNQISKIELKIDLYNSSRLKNSIYSIWVIGKSKGNYFPSSVLFELFKENFNRQNRFDNINVEGREHITVNLLGRPHNLMGMNAPTLLFNEEKELAFQFQWNDEKANTHLFSITSIIIIQDWIAI